MTAGTGDGDGRTCGNCGTKDPCSRYLKQGKMEACGDWTPKPQPQVAPIGLDVMSVLDDDGLVNHVLGTTPLYKNCTCDECDDAKVCINAYRDAVLNRIKELRK